MARQLYVAAHISCLSHGLTHWAAGGYHSLTCTCADKVPQLVVDTTTAAAAQQVLTCTPCMVRQEQRGAALWLDCGTAWRLCRCADTDLQVRGHNDSRCKASAESRFALQAENSVVLLCRDHAPGAPGIRDLDLDLSLWQPLIEDRAFVPWLVKSPNEQVRGSPTQLTADCRPCRMLKQHHFKAEQVDEPSVCHMSTRSCTAIADSQCRCHSHEPRSLHVEACRNCRRP